MKDRLKITLLSDVPPDASYTAGQVLDKIIDNTRFADFTFYWLNQSDLPFPNKLSHRCPLQETFTFDLKFFGKNVSKRILRTLNAIPKIQKIFSLAFSFLATIKNGIQISQKLRKSDANLVWLVLQGEKLALTYFIIQKLSGKKTILHQWDPIDWWMVHKGHSKLCIRFAESIVVKIEKQAALNLVPSDAWRLDQSQRGLNSVRIDNFFLEADVPTANLPTTSSKTELHAVFLGQLYSNAELTQLLRVLEQETQNLGRRPVLHYYGASAASLNIRGIELVNHGFMSRSELVTHISQWHLALLPYPMETHYDKTSRFSFPSKSRVYLAAGLPILSYCHLNSSPHTFFNKNYSEAYHNGFIESDLSNFLNNILDIKSKESAGRISFAKQLITNNFSEKAELEPFHKALLKL
jgi:hypothetical protein